MYPHGHGIGMEVREDDHTKPNHLGASVTIVPVPVERTHQKLRIDRVKFDIKALGECRIEWILRLYGFDTFFVIEIYKPQFWSSSLNHWGLCLECFGRYPV